MFQTPLIEYFPKGYTPSTQQVDIINSIQKIFETKKIAIINAPTGSGKSFVTKTIGNHSNDVDKKVRQAVESYRIYSADFEFDQEFQDLQLQGGTFVLTLTKNLQQQYKDLFDTPIFKGKVNYQCEIDTDCTVESAPCIYTPGLMGSCWQKGICPYYNARNNAFIQKLSVLNYSSFLTMREDLRRRQYIICDEASELEDELVKRNTCKFDVDKLSKMKVDISLPKSKKVNWKFWLRDVRDEIQNGVEAAASKLKVSKLRTDQFIYSYLLNLQRTVQVCIDRWDECEYIFCEDTNNPTTYTFTPIYIRPFVTQILNAGTKILLMSATLIDHQHYAKVLGIDPSQYGYYESKSVFDSKKAPIYGLTKYSLNHKNLQKNLPDIIKIIGDICSQHKDEKGIIHTHTHAITNSIQRSLGSGRFLYRSNDMTNEEILTLHESRTDPTVLVSPSLTHGVDLKGDLARFQIIIKAPYMSLGDERTKRLFNIDNDWYANKMLSTVIQASGRGNRSVDDVCVTYILDNNIISTIQRNKHKLPGYFLERFV